jgi:2'-5' RNA ligase
MRLFIAIDLPEAWKQILALPEASIGWLGHGVKWVEPRGMHLTLKFLGDVEESQLAAVKAGITRACKGCTAFPMQIHGTGAFPNNRRPRVYWAGLVSPPTLMELQSRLESEMQVLGFPRDEHSFRPHLTLARIKEPIGKDRMTEALLNFRLEGDPIQVSEVLLMQSHLFPGGARYEAVGRFSLETV